MKSLPLVAVYWDDAHGNGPEWSDDISPQDLDHKPTPMVSVGWLLRDDDWGVSLACEQSGEDSYRGHTFVIRANVVAVRMLRKGGLWNRPTEPTGEAPNSTP